MKNINKILEKYKNFKGAQLRSIEQLADSSKIVTLVITDDDEEETNIVKIEFTNINSSKILVNSVLSFLDMMSGITLIKENNLYGFAIGSGTAMVHVHSSPLYIVSSNIVIKEEEIK